VIIESSRFGRLELAQEQLIEFPHGLIGIPGSGYAFVDPTPGSAFRWLHSTEHPALALPVVDPRLLALAFTLEVGAEERQRIGLDDLLQADLYVTVRATGDPSEASVNMRAPLVVWQGRGYQVINTAPGASLRASLTAAVDTGTRLNRA
jgi:flagellar assembly factor FliW